MTFLYKSLKNALTQFLSLTIITFSFSIFPANVSKPPQELVILNWSEYMLPEMILAFEKEYNATVKEIYYESDDARDQILLQTKGQGFDLILINGAVIDSYKKRNWLQSIELENIPNSKYIEEKWQNSFISAKNYAIPYFWGTLGIAYREDLVDTPITSWKQFFNPEEKLRGKILLVNSSRDILGMALKSLGYSANSESITELNEVKKLLLSQKPYISHYGYIALDKTSSLNNGNIIAATVYGGDALNAAEHNKNITYVLPQEGGNIWVDFLALSAQSKNPQLAANFLNFINSPKWAAKNAENMYLATPNIAAKKLLSDELLNDPVIYPDKEILSRSEFYKELSPQTLRTRAIIYSIIRE